jgi:hypothetical protein
MPKYEVAVYNEDVRQMIKQGDKHEFLSDDWANINYLEIRADSEQQARSKASSKYPPNQGYVIESITPVMEI